MFSVIHNTFKLDNDYKRWTNVQEKLIVLDLVY